MKNYTKISRLTIWLILLLISSDMYAQARYDDWPVTVLTNKREKAKKDGPHTNFVPIGRSWDRRILTFAFRNGTNDIGGDDERQAIRQAFDIWAAQTDLTFLEICDPNNADIAFLWGEDAHGDPVAGGDFDGRFNGSTPNTLAHQLGGPAPGANPAFGNEAGDIHFDDAEDWVNQDRGGNTNQPIDLVTGAAHEIGHALGLDHTTVGGSLMVDNYTGSHRFLGSDDNAGIQSIYGIRNNNFVRSPNIDINTQPICGSVVLVIDNIPAGTTLAWTSSNSTALDISSGGIATRQNNFNGLVTVTATINSGCGTLTLTKVVKVGLPTISNVLVDNILNPGPVAVNSGSTHYVQTTSSNDPSTYSLSASTNSGSIILNLTGINAGNCQINVSGNNGNAALNIAASNGCGTNARSVIFYIPSGFRIAPNPAKDNITVMFDDASYQEGLPDKFELVSEKEGRSLQSIDVREMFAKKLFKNGNQVVFDIRNYPRGTYFLRVINPRQPDEKKVEVIRLIFE